MFSVVCLLFDFDLDEVILYFRQTLVNLRRRAMTIIKLLLKVASVDFVDPLNILVILN